jgi:hypothetical protein
VTYEGLDLAVNEKDRTVIFFREGVKRVPFPDEYPQDGYGVSVIFHKNQPVIAHPDHPPYIYKEGKWEKLTPQAGSYYALYRWVS